MAKNQSSSGRVRLSLTDNEAEYISELGRLSERYSREARKLRWRRHGLPPKPIDLTVFELANALRQGARSKLIPELIKNQDAIHPHALRHLLGILHDRAAMLRKLADDLDSIASRFNEKPLGEVHDRADSVAPVREYFTRQDAEFETWRLKTIKTKTIKTIKTIRENSPPIDKAAKALGDWVAPCKQMLGKLSQYKGALALSIVTALASCLLWVFILASFRVRATGFVASCVLSLLVPLGIWLQSSFIRYGGAAFLILTGGSLLWPLISSGAGRDTILPMWALTFVVVGALNWLTAGILLSSKQFAKEFAFEREHQPKYKTYLKRSVIIALVAGIIIPPLIDIMRLAFN